MSEFFSKEPPPTTTPPSSPRPQPNTDTRTPRAPSRSTRGGVGALALDGGFLSPEQINLIFKHIPLDITFVDHFDEVKFYNKGKERVFPRSPGIIDREVRYCHPPKSVHMVERIVDAFKLGRRDLAEFWIQMRGRFVHIRYFAVRDEEGEYHGVLETTQDVTDIRE